MVSEIQTSTNLTETVEGTNLTHLEYPLKYLFRL